MFKNMDKLTNSSQLLFVVGTLSICLDLFTSKKLGSGLGKALVSGLWLAVMLYQNQCLGPRNCNVYSWILTSLLVFSMLMKIYFVNIKGVPIEVLRARANANVEYTNGSANVQVNSENFNDNDESEYFTQVRTCM